MKFPFWRNIKMITFAKTLILAYSAALLNLSSPVAPPTGNKGVCLWSEKYEKNSVMPEGKSDVSSIREIKNIFFTKKNKKNSKTPTKAILIINATRYNKFK